MQGLILFIVYAISIINSGQASTTLIRDYTAAEATLAGVSVAETLHIIDNESHDNPLAKGDYVSGVPTSFGISQIHLIAHKDITKEQAYNAVFSIEYLVNQLKQGNGHIWSTYDPALNSD